MGLKFISKRPPIDTLKAHIIKSYNFMEVPMITFIDKFYVLLHLANKRDYLHAWVREVRVVGCQFRLFNWSIDFNVRKESSVVVQWIFLPRLS